MILPSRNHANAIIREGRLELDQGNCTICYDGNSLRLAVIEYRILAFLIRKAGDVVTYRALAEKALGWVEYDVRRLPECLSLVIHRTGLRLAQVGAPNLIESIDSIGYRLAPATNACFDP